MRDFRGSVGGNLYPLYTLIGDNSSGDYYPAVRAHKDGKEGAGIDKDKALALS
jgi:hypothetical protein